MENAVEEELLLRAGPAFPLGKLLLTLQRKQRRGGHPSCLLQMRSACEEGNSWEGSGDRHSWGGEENNREGTLGR